MTKNYLYPITFSIFSLELNLQTFNSIDNEKSEPNKLIIFTVSKNTLYMLKSIYI